MLHTDCLFADDLLFFKAHAHPGTYKSLMVLRKTGFIFGGFVGVYWNSPALAALGDGLQLLATISNLQLFNSSEER